MEDYNKSLVDRGNLTIWLSEEVLKNGYVAKPEPAERGRPLTYSDNCIELALTLRSLFKLPLRGKQGLLQGLTHRLGLSLQIPHDSRYSRRASHLDIKLKRFAQNDQLPTDMVVDPTGLKVYGEGEWKMRNHGKQKRSTRIKLQVAADPNTHELTAIELTGSNVQDCQMLKTL